MALFDQPLKQSLELYPKDGKRKYQRRMRGRLDITLAVMEAMTLESLPTNLLRRANTSWSTLEEILKLLIEKGMSTMEENQGEFIGRRRWFLTRKGEETVRNYRSLKAEFS